MINIKISTCAPDWPWKRQLPSNVSEWGVFRFHIDTDIEECDLWFVFESLTVPDKTRCSPERVVFITGEPDSIGKYSNSFLKQFSHVITGRNDITHPKVIRMQQGQPWFVEKNFDQLVSMPAPKKTKELCILTSSKNFTDGHRKRLEFVEAIKNNLGDKVDVYGRGIKEFDNKWNLLTQYKYTLVLENYLGNDFITEKLPDAWLAYCLPFYSGSTNVQNYFNENSYVQLDINDICQSLYVIEKALADDIYHNALTNITNARDSYLNDYQFFALIKCVTRSLLATTIASKKMITLAPNAESKHIGLLRRLFN